MEFCKNCRNIIVMKLIDGKIKKYCEDCKLAVELTSNILKKIVNCDSDSIDQKKLDGALYDDTYPYKTEKCNGCDNNKIYWFRMDNMKIVRVCRKCKEWWTI